MMRLHKHISRLLFRLALFILIAFIPFTSLIQAGVRLKSVARLSGLQENPITGYGLVIGLAGSGDSRRNKDTTQAISNLLQTFGVNISPHEISSRNTATVIITANLPSYAHTGDKIDINVASLGDAKSLLGGTLLATPLKGTDNRIYALAQGPISIGGFKYDLYGNVIQKNHPTAGLIPGGAIVQKTLYNDVMDKTGDMHLILNHPDFTTADNIEAAINKKFGKNTALARSAQDIEIHPPITSRKHFIRFISQLENLTITPDNLPTVVVNERTGVIIAGSDVTLDAVTISYGNLQIAIATDFNVSQPTLVQNIGRQVRTTVTPSTNINVKESNANTVKLKKGATIGDLIAALNTIQTSTRDIIAILESLQRAGALHAELVIQ
ncbi:flagellar basal body P-ring protein FlgI [Legionella norrlandica]|uniref:flagellar basal body P-ring protein FlgI n=1 Tax=Legionella norrlandica TaxID=1498499 RepID=UPI001F4CFA45|nr:flagellar basal body P-ring protein FlgI [Legionella norrlandica]